MRQDILSYNGKGKPLTREVSFRAVSGTPHDLNCTIVLDGIKIPTNGIQIERMAEPPAVDTTLILMVKTTHTASMPEVAYQRLIK